MPHLSCDQNFASCPDIVSRIQTAPSLYCQEEGPPFLQWNGSSFLITFFPHTQRRFWFGLPVSIFPSGQHAPPPFSSRRSLFPSRPFLMYFTRPRGPRTCSGGSPTLTGAPLQVPVKVPPFPLVYGLCPRNTFLRLISFSRFPVPPLSWLDIPTSAVFFRPVPCPRKFPLPCAHPCAFLFSSFYSAFFFSAGPPPFPLIISPCPLNLLCPFSSG